VTSAGRAGAFILVQFDGVTAGVDNRRRRDAAVGRVDVGAITFI
jgi:hypothetical protein